jgi:hypothetical protein
MNSLFERLMEVAADPVATRRILAQHQRTRRRRRVVAVMQTSPSDIDSWLKQMVPPASKGDGRHKPSTK